MKIFRLTLVLMIALTFAFIWLRPDDRLHLVFCDVGQGDATIVIYGSFQALIDTGGNEEKILACLAEHLPFWDRKIELVIVSHDQKDHDGTLGVITRRYAVIRVIGSKSVAGDEVSYKELYFDMLWPEKNTAGRGDQSENDANGESVVTQLSFKKFSGLFTGDISEKEESALILRGVLSKISVLKVPHHGSKYSSSLPFLSMIDPIIAVVSVGAKNTYGHPAAEALSRIDAVGAKILRTDQRGTIEIISDGENFSVKSER